MEVSAQRNIKDKLLQTQMEILYGNIHFIVIGNIIVSSISAIILWPLVSHQILIIWLSLIFITSIYRLVIKEYDRENKITSNKLKRNMYLVGSFSSGCIWGYSGIFDVPIESYYYIAFILCGLTVNAVASSSAYRPATYSFIVPAVLPITIFSFMHEGENWFYLSIMSFSYLLTLIGYTNVLNKSSNSSINLRFSNLDLIDQLTKQKIEVTKAKEDAENANIDKSRFLAAASHDLRQPLHSLVLFIDILKNSNSKQEKDLVCDKVAQSAHDLSCLLDALLDISKLDTEVIDICRDDISINNILGML